jgi:hypothetical protein
MAVNEFAPVTPGEMLKEEFLAAYGLSQSGLAKAIGISPNRIAEIVNNRRRITDQGGSGCVKGRFDPGAAASVARMSAAISGFAAPVRPEALAARF